MINTSILLKDRVAADTYLARYLALNPFYTLRDDDLAELGPLLNQYESEQNLPLA